jgi:hypothetical protein
MAKPGNYLRIAGRLEAREPRQTKGGEGTVLTKRFCVLVWSGLYIGSWKHKMILLRSCYHCVPFSLLEPLKVAETHAMIPPLCWSPSQAADSLAATLPQSLSSSSSRLSGHALSSLAKPSMAELVWTTLWLRLNVVL